LKGLSDERIAIAQRSLVDFLGEERLDGKTFLDVGSGSGLFSLAARRLGANVRSFDFDPSSVACARELKRRYFPDDPCWIVEEQSILDRAFIDQLGTYDIVYSWGVLHHTGQMFVALENVKKLVAMGGKLFIAIYNDLEDVTDRWAAIKKRYNQLASPMAFLFALGIIAREESISLFGAVRARRPDQWLKSWIDYDKLSTRGMSKWHDTIDWIGGWPYERATVESIVDFYAKDGFRLIKLKDRSSGYGCNEYVFRKEAGSGTFIDVPIPGGNSMARRFGRRVLGPLRMGSHGVVGRLPARTAQGGDPVWLMAADQIVGPAVFENACDVVVGRHEADIALLERSSHFVVGGQLRNLEGRFDRVRGNMWMTPAPEFEHLADKIGAERQSPLFVFENGRQLLKPHTTHAEIIKCGSGRFSHWGSAIYLSASDKIPIETDVDTRRSFPTQPR
jgi:SAM-dependent methyltransferase